MSQLIIRKNNRSKYNDEDSQTNDRSINEKVKYLTPRKFRSTQRTPLSNMNDQIQFNKDEYSLTPSKYRLNKSNHQDNTKLLYNKYPVIIGEFTLTQRPSEDNSIYNYKPKYTQIPYVYQGTANTLEVRERARNEIKQYAQSSNPSQKKIPFMNNRNHYQSMLTLPTNNYRSTTENELIRNHSRDPIYGSLRRRNYSFTSLYPSNSPHIRIQHDDPYYFGERSGYGSPDDVEDEESSSEDELCISLGHDSYRKPILKYSTFIPPIVTNYNRHIDIIFQEVVDVGTSTDDLQSDTSSSQLQSLATNQSSRSATEIYRVSHQILDRDNYEEPDTVPFPTVKYPPSVSSSSSPTIVLNKNQYEMSSIDIDETSKDENEEQENNHVENGDDEETQGSTTPEPSIQLQRLPRQNPIVNLPIPRYENVPMNYQPEPSISHKSMKSDKSRRSIFIFI
jgi:hypothetical protein